VAGQSATAILRRARRDWFIASLPVSPHIGPAITSSSLSGFDAAGSYDTPYQQSSPDPGALPSCWTSDRRGCPLAV